MAGRPGRVRKAGAVAALWVAAAGVGAVAGVAGAGAAGSAVTLFAAPAATGSGSCLSATTACTLAAAVTKAEATEHGHPVTVHAAAGLYVHVALSLDATTLTSLALVGAGTSGGTILESTGAMQDLSATGTHAVAVSGVQVTGGHGRTGGCVETTASDLVLTHVQVAGCRATFGGGIFVHTGAAVTVETASVSTDTAVDTGGGIDNYGTITLSHDTVDHDTATTLWGGGVDTWHHATVTASAFAHDAAGKVGGAFVTEHSSSATFTAVTVSTDTAATGGGAAALSATLRVTGSTFVHDTATTAGGGLTSLTSAVLAVSGSTISTDHAARGGGLNVGAKTPAKGTVTKSVLSGDTAGTGAAVCANPKSTVTLSGDTVSSDAASVWGGGVDNFGGNLTVAGTTFSTDTSHGDGGGVVTETGGAATLTNVTLTADAAHYGGAVANTATSTSTLTDVTMARNHATTQGWGLWVETGAVTVADSVVYDDGCARGTGTIADGGHNVASTSSCGFGHTSVSTSATIGLAATLAANTSSGPPTLSITPKSSAFEAVPAAACTVTVDERGLPRPGAAGQSCDAGAYEYQLTGYDLVGSDGGVFVFNPPGVHTKGFYGSLPGIGVTPVAPIVGLVSTSTDLGYFLVGADGGVFAFGPTAPFHGSLPGIGVTPAAPIVGIVTAHTDTGYFLVGADGGVYAFGTVPFLGSLPGMHVSRTDIIGIAATPSGNGYWVVAATGKVYAFGTATSFTTIATTSPVTAIAGTPTGGGYWLVTRLGGVYPYGNAQKQGEGTLPAIHVTPHLPVVGIVRVAATAGYWLIGRDGGIFAFGTAPFVGSLPGLTPPVTVADVVGAVPN